MFQFEQVIDITLSSEQEENDGNNDNNDNVILKVGISGLDENRSESFISSLSSNYTLFLIHGMGSSNYTWHNQVKQLSPYFQIICPDLRAHGRLSYPYNLPLSYSIQYE